ncbi:transmembrane protein 237B-like isoform X2 [Boleophthalmus pectinirostris]|uniref:transmembrane protein 237B-like isoform X2 n=1 Tax=Boleophthalmus pectinirostris TaxID=150288 RepID=UPI000A1C31E2|nr:transmembrane protein 237B-like isoform X2 [Boleophthalmus pectinirostris]
MRPRELPPLPQRGQRTLPTMPSEDSVGEAPKRKKKKLRKQFTVDTDDGAVEMRGVSSSQLSDPGEHLPSDSHPDPAPQKSRRKKKKAATIDLEDYQADLVNTEAVEQSTEAVEVVKKTKKKKKPKHAEVPLPDELTVEEDDITTDGPPAHPHFMFTAPQTQSQPVAKVFVERNRRFQASERARGSRGSEQLDHMDLQPLVVWSTRDVSVRLHQGFRTLGLFCQGFLAGFAMWHIVVVYVLAGPHLTALSNLLQQYHGLAYPCQCLLYLLLVLSTVGAFDRVNLAKGSLTLRQLMTLEPVALVSFLYFCALILSLSQQMTSDRINLYTSFNSSLWLTGTEQQTLHPWVTINLVVALLVGVSWVFISTQPDTDHTEVFLMSMRIEAPKEEKSEMTA